MEPTRLFPNKQALNKISQTVRNIRNTSSSLLLFQ